MRFSRPCYDKYHRCPGWAGGGLRYAKRKRCDNGHVQVDYDDPRWEWKFQKCDTCGVLVLPSHSRWLDPTWIAYKAGALKDRFWRWQFYMGLDRKHRKQTGERFNPLEWFYNALDEWDKA